MGQHQIQRQILRNFTFPGRQPNSLETWHLSSDSYRPSKRSTKGIGVFEVDCSVDVDDFITRRENEFKDLLHRFSDGRFTKTDVGRDLYDFIALHYVRSHAFSLQIRHLASVYRRNSVLTETQAESEFRRLTNHQDVALFRELVECVSRVLTHYIVCPVITDSRWSFVTSDKIVTAATFETSHRPTMAWFPISPSIGFYLDSDGKTGQILGPTEVAPGSGTIKFVKVPEAAWLRTQKPEPVEADGAFFDTLNAMMVENSTEILACDRRALDAALINTRQPTGYKYQVAADCDAD